MIVKELMQQLSTCSPNAVVLMLSDDNGGVMSLDWCRLVATHRDKRDPHGAVGIIQLSGDSYYHSVENAIENIF